MRAEPVAWQIIDNGRLIGYISKGSANGQCKMTVIGVREFEDTYYNTVDEALAALRNYLQK